MTLSSDSLVTLLTAGAGIVTTGLGAIVGALWGHQKELGKRVTHEQCRKKRKDCPCHKKLKEMKKEQKEKKAENETCQ